MCPCGCFIFLEKDRACLNAYNVLKMRNTGVGTAPCCSLGVQPGAPGLASPRPGRRESSEWRGGAENVFQPAGCQGCLWCRLWGTWPCYLAGGAVISVLGWGRTGAVCSVLEWGVPGSGVGMWQEGGNSCLPRAWVHGPTNLYVHEVSLQQWARAYPGATSSSQSLPSEVGKAQRKQAAEKGAFVESRGWSRDWKEVASAVWPGRWPAGAATRSPLFIGGKSPNPHWKLKIQFYLESYWGL